MLVHQGKAAEKDPAVEKLEELKLRMTEARDLFRNQEVGVFVFEFEFELELLIS